MTITPSDIIPSRANVLWTMAEWLKLWGLANGYASLDANALPRLPLRYINGFGPINGTDATNDLDINDGICRDSSDGYNIVGAAMVGLRADAGWAAGANQGKMASGVSWAANTFHVFVLGKTTDATAYEYGYDTSLTAANLLATAAVSEAGYNIYRRVASFATIGAAWPVFITRRVDLGLEILLEPAFEFTKNWSGGADDTAQSGTLSRCPNGLAMFVRLGVTIVDATAAVTAAFLFTSPLITDIAPVDAIGTWVGQFRTNNSGATTISRDSGEVEVLTTNATVRYRGKNTTTDHQLAVCMLSFYDRRME